MKVENSSSEWPRNEDLCKTVLDTARAVHSVCRTFLGVTLIIVTWYMYLKKYHNG